MSDYFVYKVAESFSRFPGGRKKNHGDFSGEEFFEAVTKPLLNQHPFVEFDLSGSEGYSSGFLDEAFGEIGALIGLDEAKRRVRIVASDDDEAVETCWERITDAANEAHKK